MARPRGTASKKTDIEKLLSFTENEVSAITGKLICTRCGKGYQHLTNFFTSCSPLWASHSRRIPICISCVDEMYEKYKEEYQDPHMAIRRICMTFDYYYDDDLVAPSIDANKTGTVMGKYVRKLNISSCKNKTFDDTIREEGLMRVTKDSFEEDMAKNEAQVSRAAFDRWGAGMFDYNELSILEDHYKMLKRNNPNLDSNQDIFIKDLCILHLMKMKAAKEKKSDDFNKTSEQYSKIFAKAGLKTTEDKDTTTDTLGVNLQLIAQYTPEEYYKDKKLFADYDYLGEYYDRHIRRPMQNLMMGTDVRDPEYHVPETGEEEGDTSDG